MESRISKSSISTKKLVELGILTALVIILQLLGSFIRFGPFSVSLVLVPVVLGGALLGAPAGAWLGLVFGGTVLLSGDAAAFLTIDPFGTVLTVLLKGALAGFGAGLVYRFASKWNKWAALLLAALACPVLNTGVFLLGCKIFFMPTITEWASTLGYASVGKYIILGLVGGNFLFEVGFNMVLVPVLYRVITLLTEKKQAVV